MTWFAIYTKPGSEDLVAQRMNDAGIETLAPKIIAIKYRRRKYTRVIEHLFPCYIFACFEHLTHGHMVKYTRGVKFIVGKENPLEVNPEIIDALRTRMKGEIIEPEEEVIQKGEKVLIKEGPFKDFQGVFERGIPGKARVMILIEAIHGRLEIDRRAVKKA
jgi:transcriptional antiterminator RfaH